MGDFSKFNNLLIESDNLYEIGTYNYAFNSGITLYNFILQNKHEMNLRQVSLDLYNNPDEVITIMDMNSIVNPYSVYSGQIIIVTLPEQLDFIKKNDTVLNNLKNALIDSQKGKKTDNSKIIYNNNVYNNQKEEKNISYLKNKNDIKKVGNVIKIGPGF